MATLEEKMFSEAEFGMFYIYHKISLKKANELRNLGFEVTDSKENRAFPRTHRIGWFGSGLKLAQKNIDELNEDDPGYSLPEKLWIISNKVLKDPVDYYKKA